MRFLDRRILVPDSPQAGWILLNRESMASDPPGMLMVRGPNSRLQSKSLFLSYINKEISEDEYRDWFVREIMHRHCLGGQLETFEFYRTQKPVLSELQGNTYVLVLTTEKVFTRKMEVLDWDGARPEIRTLRGRLQIEAAKVYAQRMCELESENVEMPPPIKKLVLQEDIPRKHSTVEVFDEHPEALIPLDKMVHWQAEVVAMMDENSSADKKWVERRKPKRLEKPIEDRVEGEMTGSEVIRSANEEPPRPKEYVPGLADVASQHCAVVHVIYSREGRCGMTTLLSALQKSDEKRFLILHNVPFRADLLAYCNRAREIGAWTGDALIFDVGRSHKGNKEHKGRRIDVYDTIQTAIDMTYCKNIWVFSKKLYDIEQLSFKRWKFYEVWADLEASKMSFLERFYDCRAYDIYYDQRIDEKRRKRDGTPK